MQRDADQTMTINGKRPNWHSRLAKLNPLRRLSVLNQFVLAIAVILLSGALVIGWWINRRIEEDVASNVLRLTVIFVDATIAPHVRDLDGVGSLSPEQKMHIDQLMHTDIGPDNFVAFHIWKTDGTCAYTNLLDSPPGILHQHSAKFAAALQGEWSVNFTNFVDGAPQLGNALDLLEMYIPVRDSSGDRVLAVIEFYQSLTMLRQSISLSQLQGWAVVGVSTFLMFVVLYSLAKRANDTIERQTRELAESRQQIQRAAMRAAEVNEAFMRRLGSDLHDGPAQDLGIALMRIEPLRHGLSQCGPAAARAGNCAVADTVTYDLDLIHTALQSSIHEIRQIAGGLRLPDLRGMDLASVIRKAATDYSLKTSRAVTVTGQPSAPGSDALRTAVYRIVQEALNNGHQHGNPVSQSVTFEVMPGDTLHLAIVDDGCGFEPGRSRDLNERRSLGLSGLQERAEVLGGQLVVHSQPGQGTLVQAWLPLTNADPMLAADSFGESGASA